MHDLGRFASRDRARTPVQLFENRIIKDVNRVVYDVTVQTAEDERV